MSRVEVPHGSGTVGYGLEPPVLVLEIAEPESNREGVSRLRFRFRFQNPGFRFQFRIDGFYGFEPAVFNGFLQFRLDSTVFRGSGTVSVRKFLNLNRTTVLKLMVSILVNFHGSGAKP